MPLTISNFDGGDEDSIEHTHLSQKPANAPSFSQGTPVTSLSKNLSTFGIEDDSPKLLSPVLQNMKKSSESMHSFEDESEDGLLSPPSDYAKPKKFKPSSDDMDLSPLHSPPPKKLIPSRSNPPEIEDEIMRDSFSTKKKKDIFHSYLSDLESDNEIQSPIIIRRRNLKRQNKSSKKNSKKQKFSFC